MKVLCNLLGLFLLTGIISCNDDESAEYEANLLGTWQATDIILRECTDESHHLSKDVKCPGTDCIKYIFAIDSNDTRSYIKELVLSTGSMYETGTFSLGETKIEFCFDHEGEQECISSRFSVSPSTLVILTEDTDAHCTKEIKLVKEYEK